MKFVAPRLAVALAIAVSAGSALAAERPASRATQGSAKTPTAQQQKMKDCNAQATGKKGAERNDFMKTCLKADSSASTGGAVAVPPPLPASQREKMKTCNADANTKSLKGDARKSFMSTCLKGNDAAAPAAAH
jgi:Flp pilus assembly protein TadG